MNTEDKFHPVNTIQRALDYGEPLDRDEVRELLQVFRELEANNDGAEQIQLLEERIEELQEARENLREQLCQAKKDRDDLLAEIRDDLGSLIEQARAAQSHA